MKKRSNAGWNGQRLTGRRQYQVEHLIVEKNEDGDGLLFEKLSKHHPNGNDAYYMRITPIFANRFLKFVVPAITFSPEMLIKAVIKLLMISSKRPGPWAEYLAMGIRILEGEKKAIEFFESVGALRSKDRKTALEAFIKNNCKSYVGSFWAEYAKEANDFVLIEDFDNGLTFEEIEAIEEGVKNPPKANQIGEENEDDFEDL